MKKIILTCLGMSFALASPVLAKKEFGGPFAGLGVAYSYTNSKFYEMSYKGMSFASRIFGGYGWINDQLYYGVEGGLWCDSFSKKKESSRLRRKWMAEGSFRVGRLIRNHFLPFARLGMRYDRYALKPIGRRTDHLGAAMLLWGVGVDAFVEENISIRSEFNYAMPLSLHSTKAQCGKKPLSAGVTMAVSYHF